MPKTLAARDWRFYYSVHPYWVIEMTVTVLSEVAARAAPVVEKHYSSALNLNNIKDKDAELYDYKNFNCITYTYN